MSIRIKIAIIGSTGSVGKTTLSIIDKYPKKFKVEFLACDKNFDTIVSQAKKFLPNYIYVNNKEIFDKLKKKKFKKKINFVNNYDVIKKIFKLKKKFDKTILSISSLDGLKFAFDFVKFSKEILIANKESIVCGGNILLREAEKYNCKIKSIDSEHYCLSQFIKKNEDENIDSIYLTASGGPFLNMKKNSYNKASIHKVTNHPNWSMGKKISVDSATMVNKVLEIIEAHVLFGLPFDKIKIKIHKESLVHSAIVLKNGLVNLVMHDTSMTIPIRNSLFDNKFFNQSSNFFKSNKKFELTFNELELKKFKIIKTAYKIIKNGHSSWILFNVFNDYLVKKFLLKKIYFYEIEQNLIKVFNNKHILSYCKKNLNTIDDINRTIHFAMEKCKKL